MIKNSIEAFVKLWSVKKDATGEILAPDPKKVREFFTRAEKELLDSNGASYLYVSSEGRVRWSETDSEGRHIDRLDRKEK